MKTVKKPSDVTKNACVDSAEIYAASASARQELLRV